MHQPRLPRQTPLQGLRAHQAPSAIGRRAEGRKMQRSSGQERGRSGQGSGRLKVEVIRPDAYRLKDDDDDILTNAWNSYVIFSLKFSLTIVYLTFAPIKAPRPETLLARVARGLHEGALLPLFFRLLLYGETPSYANKRIVRSFNLPYVALL